MALITKIREKSGIAAGAIAISLILFLVGSDLFQGRSSFFGESKDVVGEIGGEKIKYQDFQTKVEEISQQYTQQSGRGPGEQELSMIRDQVWNQYILDFAYGKEGIRKELITRGKLVKEYSTAKGKPKDGMIVIIKPSKKSTYRNLVDILDEMAIVDVPTYAIVNEFTPEETKLLAAK